MVQAQLKQLDQLREVNKRYHTHTVELKDKIAELIVSTHFDVMMHKNTITSYYYVIVITPLRGNYPIYSHEHEGAKRPSASDCKRIIHEYTGCYN